MAVKNKEVQTQFIRARTALYIEQPMYGVLALRLRMVEHVNDPRIKTLAVSSKNIHYNPDYVATLDPLETMSAIAHELQHIMLDHLDRRMGRTPGRWNAACDYVVNAAIKRDGFRLNKHWLYKKEFEGMTSDHVYALLPEDGGGGGDEPGDGPNDWGAMDDMIPGDPMDADEAKTDWEVAIVGAARIAKEAGKLPASMERFIDKLMNNKVHWRERLRRFAMQYSKNDFSWMRPQRRMLPYGIFLPSLHSESMQLLINSIDTSGSIDEYTLNMFGAEVIAAKNAASPDSMVNIYCDAAVNHVDTFGQFDEVKFKLHGGGDTDFRPPFAYIEEQGLKPSCLIYLTDGYGPFPEAPPPYPVLWVMTTNVVAPWGETIRIET